MDFLTRHQKFNNKKKIGPFNTKSNFKITEEEEMPKVLRGTIDLSLIKNYVIISKFFDM